MCLYQSPATEWDPNDGMFGFLVRLDDWLTQAAANELDPTGAPLHPPVAYPGIDRMLIPRVDTPEINNTVWIGIAEIDPVSERRVDVSGWSSVFDEAEPPDNAAAAILLPEPMPFEFPTKLTELLEVLGQRGVPRKLLLAALQYAAVHNGEDDPLYVLLGTPMRGIRGEKLKQHLTGWYIEPILAKALRLALGQLDENVKLQEIGDRAEQIIWEWAEGASVKWCTVQELWPEIVTRRDAKAPMSWFADRVVAIWGCGALGSFLAELIVRAGARKLILVDKDRVKPGILVRQRFDDADIGESKSEALARALKRVRPDVEVDAHTGDVLANQLEEDDWVGGAELLIDATAARAVLKKLELRCHSAEGITTPVSSVVVGPRAERGLLVLAKASHSGGPVDVLRRTRMSLQSRRDVSAFREAFWPDRTVGQGRLFQPEPGCSSPTFVGSAADVVSLAGAMLNRLATELAITDDSPPAVAHLLGPPQTNEDPEAEHLRLDWGRDRLVHDSRAGYEVRLAADAWTEMKRWVARGRRRRGPLVETGGLVLGEIDRAAKVIWVSEASGPPPDSSFSEAEFVCGRIGTAELSERRSRETEGAVSIRWDVAHPSRRTSNTKRN